MGERFEEGRVERLNAQGLDGRDCPLCYLVRSSTLVGERKLGALIRCAGCFARFRFQYLGVTPLYDVLERIPTPVPARATFAPATDKQHNAGARIADDFACKCCGARGWRTYCPTCERAA